jgi:outer membrane protein
VRLNAGVANPLDYTLAKTNLDRVKASFVQTKYEWIFRDRIVAFYEEGTIK